MTRTWIGSRIDYLISVGIKPAKAAEQARRELANYARRNIEPTIGW